MKLPPGVSSTDFASAVAAFEQAVGKNWVFTSDEDVDLYGDAFSPFLHEPEELVASAAVAPASTEQVQKIVRIANRHKVPLYPISTGKNLGYGGSAPAYSGSVVVDLKRMNRVIEVNEANAFALVEPGVSYFDLYRDIQERKLKVWIDCPDPGWGSVIGNALDRGGGYTSANHRNHFDSHCGMEIVLPNGELLRTGMGAVPNAKTWQQYKSGCGPWIDGIFSQSNFGIVTKMGFVAEFLRPSGSHRRAVARDAAAFREDRGRKVSRRRSPQRAHRYGQGGGLPRAGIRHSVAAGLLDRRPHSLEPDSIQGAHVVLAHHPAHRRGHRRGESGVQRRGARFGDAAISVVHAAGLLLGAR